MNAAGYLLLAAVVALLTAAAAAAACGWHCCLRVGPSDHSFVGF